jgi:plastocyanin
MNDRSCSRPRRLAALALVAGCVSLGAALADELHRVAQKGRQFAVATIAIARGETIEFTNEDEFLHQIYVDSPAFRFDSAEQRPGSTIDLPFPARGVFEVRCHIHPKMLLTVTVK